MPRWAVVDDADARLARMSNDAVDLIKAGKLDEAERMCHRLLDQFPDLPDGHMRLGQLFRARREPTRAALFVNWDAGEPWRDLARPWKRARRKAGLAGIWFHDLRRTFVTEARRAGVPESVVMRMSGHRTRAVFDRYNVVSEDDLRAAVARLQAPRRGHDLGKAPELT